MGTSRRSFIKQGAMCAAFAGVSGAITSVAMAESTNLGNLPSNGSIDLSRATFTPHLNTTFRIHTPSGAVKATLLSVPELKAASKNPRPITYKESFSLVFAGGRRSARFGEGIYRIEHDVLGAFSLFLTPVGLPASRKYEAVITRL